MRRILACLLAVSLILALLCACGSGESGGDTGAATTEPGAFRVGYGKANITPETNVPMGGYGRSDRRISNGILSYLWVTCIAITDSSDNTILLYSLDLTGSNEAYKLYAADVSEATGVPVENIIMSATHTHSAPDYNRTDLDGVAEALKLLSNGLIHAGEAAMADRKEAAMYGGSVKTEGMNFVRHYICNDGSYAGSNFGDASSGYAKHVHVADPVLQVIKFTREGDNDILLTNFQTHPHRTGGSTKFDISADIVGEYRDALSKALDCEVLYFSGAGGNINPYSWVPGLDPIKDFKEHGQALADYALQVEYSPLNTGSVKMMAYDFTAEIDHQYDSLAAICGELRSRWDKGEITTAELIELGAGYGIKLNSPYHAGAIKSRAGADRTGTFTIRVCSFGDVGFVAAPYEMFDTNGVFIREHSPFAMTVVATLANGGNGYFPSDATFEYGSYETDTTKYVRGTAEALADQFVSMLDELHTAP